MGIIKSGVCGTCVWGLDDENTLTIRPQNGESGVLHIKSNRRWPWRLCRHIKKIVVEKGVKTGACAAAMFAGMRDCTEFDVSELDVSAAEDMRCMFECCSSMENIAALKKWDVSNVTAMSWMFADCCSLKDVSALAGWDVSKVTYTRHMFANCGSVTDISSLKEWDISNIIYAGGMFSGCGSLEDISPLFGWDMSTVHNATEMFSGTGISYNMLDAFIPMACPREGAFIGYKRCRSGRIVQLEIPKDAKRFSAYGKKCRCDRAKVLNIWTRDGEEAENAASSFNPGFVHRKGELVEVKDFDEDRFNECAAGIHFFMTRKEAEDYVL